MEQRPGLKLARMTVPVRRHHVVRHATFRGLHLSHFGIAHVVLMALVRLGRRTENGQRQSGGDKKIWKKCFMFRYAASRLTPQKKIY